MPKVKIGDTVVPVSWGEMQAALMQKGTPVRWEKSMRLKHEKTVGVGNFDYSSYYDGIMASVKTPDGSSVHLFPGFGDRMKRIK